MMRKLASMISGIALMYGASNCGPDTVNNYYDRENDDSSSSSPKGTPPSQSNNPIDGTCEDAAAKEIECYFREGGWPHDSPHMDPAKQQNTVLNHCHDFFPQECIDCMVTAPCTFVSNSDKPDGKPYWLSPLKYCLQSGECPSCISTNSCD